MTWITLTFFLRAMYDYSRFFFMKDYERIRLKSYEEDGYQFPIFIFSLIMLCEFIPILMFVFNLRYIWNKGVILSKRMVAREKKEGSFGFFFSLKNEEPSNKENYAQVRGRMNTVNTYSNKSDSLIGSYD